MAITIIVKDGKPRGETRTSLDHKLQDVGWGTTFKDEEAADKCAFAERQLKKRLNVDSIQVRSHVFDRVGSK